MAVTPMMQHYLQTKEKYKDSILLYRLGDFYEFFYEDAIEMSNALDLTLTAKVVAQMKRRQCVVFLFKLLTLILRKWSN